DADVGAQCTQGHYWATVWLPGEYWPKPPASSHHPPDAGTCCRASPVSAGSMHAAPNRAAGRSTRPHMTLRCCGARSSPDRSACGLVSGRALALQLFGGDGAHAACLEVFEGLDDLLAGVHDEGAVAGDRFADGEAAEDEDLPAVRAGEGL